MGCCQLLLWRRHLQVQPSKIAPTLMPQCVPGWRRQKSNGKIFLCVWTCLKTNEPTQQYLNTPSQIWFWKKYSRCRGNNGSDLLSFRYVFAADLVRRGREEGLLLDLESATEMLSRAQVAPGGSVTTRFKIWNINTYVKRCEKKGNH